MAITFNSEDKSYSDGTTTLALNNGVYEINTVDQLKLFRDAVNAGNSFSGQTVKLMDSFDLKDEEMWTPIGTQSNSFAGTFDGDNNTISNLSINTPDDTHVGFFSNTKSATIKNLTINNVSIIGDNYVGAVAGYSFLGEISNCSVTGTIKISGRWFVGGITGQSYAAVDSCKVIAAEDGSESFIKGSSGYVGGISGYHGEETSISDSTVSSLTISGTSWGVGGISGLAQYGSVIEGCTVENTTISATDLNGDNVGLIAGANLGALETSEGQPANPAVLLNNKVDAATIENFMVDGKTVENPPMLGEDNNTRSSATSR